jgi:ATP-dependent DNA helicase RecG
MATIDTLRISYEQAEKIRLIQENQFVDVKERRIAPKDLTTHLSAFANSDGGDLYIGIVDIGREWDGFPTVESANGYIQCFEEFFPLSSNFQYEFLECDSYNGLVLHCQINKSQGVMLASNKTPYVRRGAQSLPLNTPDKVKRLEISKGITSFEVEKVNISKEQITESPIATQFIKEVVPTTTAENWFQKQNLIREGCPTVAGVLMFNEEPQAILPKHCGIKVYRYSTSEKEGVRDVLVETPKTVEGHLYVQINSAVQLTKEITESILFFGDDGTMENIKYPHETLHEILTNAVLHRDYSIKDDIHIRIFDNRVEVQSPGRLPGHITPKNILDERFARNGAIVRILNKFPNPPNKDVGEGLNTAFAKMHDLGLKPPVIKELENAVLVTIKHEPLASSAQIILDYLEKHGTIKNAKAREITRIPTDFKMKSIFNKLEKSGKIEKVPGTRTASTAWQLKTD